MEKQKTESENVVRFFEEYGKIFDSPDKKATFLEGVLTKFLLDKQSMDRGSTPFEAKLHGLRLDERRIKELFPIIVEKNKEYPPSYPWLEELVSKYLIDADNQGWNLSENEVSYYFTLGLCFGRFFKEKDDKKIGGK